MGILDNLFVMNENDRRLLEIVKNSNTKAFIVGRGTIITDNKSITSTNAFSGYIKKGRKIVSPDKDID